MALFDYHLTDILSVFGSVAFGAVITITANHKKTTAETLLAETQAKLNEVEIYSKMLADMKIQADIHGQQILALQKKETEYLKIIREQSLRERQLNKKINAMNQEIKILQNKLKYYEQADRVDIK